LLRQRHNTNLLEIITGKRIIAGTAFRAVPAYFHLCSDNLYQTPASILRSIPCHFTKIMVTSTGDAVMLIRAEPDDFSNKCLCIGFTLRICSKVGVNLYNL